MSDNDFPRTWAPSEQSIQDSRLRGFADHVQARHGVQLPDYDAMWRWSVTHLDDFWREVLTTSDLQYDGSTDVVRVGTGMPDVRWFPDVSLNWAQNVLRHALGPHRDQIALRHVEEDDTTVDYTWAQLEARVAGLAQALREHGVGRSDRVVAALPNLPEAAIALLAAASVGATFAIVSPDFAESAVVARLGQLEPTVLVGIDGYRYNGSVLDRTDYMAGLAAAMPTVRHRILVEHSGAVAGSGRWAGWESFTALSARTAEPRYDRVPFSHPLWVLYSSGTTGKPKGLVHSHGGITLEADKGSRLERGHQAGDVFFMITSTAWMLWNTILCTLGSGTQVVTYSGSPTAGGVGRAVDIAARCHATTFGTGAAYLQAVQNAGVRPRDTGDFSALHTVMTSGSPLPQDTHLWIQEAIKPGVRVSSISGGTDVCTAFIGSNPWQPERAGVMQGPMLGVAAAFHDDAGNAVVDAPGDLVITEPMPSMPVRFWNDADGQLYRDAYFWAGDGHWHHGDWGTAYSGGGMNVLGRSDATLNRGGVRLGSSEIYAAVEAFDEVVNSMTIGVELGEGHYHLPLFVQLRPGVELDEPLRERLRTAIATTASKRHVPDEIVAVPAIPMSKTGKKLEIPVKKLCAGFGEVTTATRETLADPASLDFYLDYARGLRS